MTVQLFCFQNLIEERMRSLNEAADLLAALSLGGVSISKNGGKIDCDEMEWKFGGGHLFRKLDPTSDSVTKPLDSDDDSDNESSNPLKVLATKEVPTVRKIRSESSTKSDQMSTLSDHLKSVNEELTSEAPYAEHLSMKADLTKARTKFAPFKSVELNSEKSKTRSEPLPTGGLRHTTR